MVIRFTRTLRSYDIIGGTLLRYVVRRQRKRNNNNNNNNSNDITLLYYIIRLLYGAGETLQWRWQAAAADLQWV